MNNREANHGYETDDTAGSLKEFYGMTHAALQIDNMRWDGDVIVLPEVFLDAEVPYESSPYGAVFSVSDTIVNAFETWDYKPDAEVADIGIVDMCAKGAVRLRKIVPDEEVKDQVAMIFFQLGNRTIQQLQQKGIIQMRNPHAHSRESFLNQRFRYVLDYYESKTNVSLNDMDKASPERLEDIVMRRAEALLSPANPELFRQVRDAYRTAVFRHNGQEHFGGLPMDSHLLQVMAARMGNRSLFMHPNDLSRDLAGLALHDILEDTAIHPDTIREQFGDDVTNIVIALSREIQATGEKRTTEEYFHELQGESQAIRNLKVIDRLCNLKNIAKILAKPTVRKYMIADAIEYLDETAERVFPLAEHNATLANELQEVHDTLTQIIETILPPFDLDPDSIGVDKHRSVA